MIEIHWGWSKARIWLDELPDWNYEVEDVVESHQEVLVRNIADRRCAAVELLQPRGGHVLYGGVGVTFVPAQTGDILIQVATSIGTREQPHNASLAGKVERVRKGLPREYVEAALAGATNAEATRLFGPGTLRIDRAVHGAVGSCNWIFAALSRIVVRLIILDRKTVMEENLLKLIRHELQSGYGTIKS